MSTSNKESFAEKTTGLLGTENDEKSRRYFMKLSSAKMPFGKYANRLLIDLPGTYVIWFKEKGFPKGELGEMLRAVYEIKLNGLEYLFKVRERGSRG